MTHGYSLADFDAVIFDMDGVVTDTAQAHAVAWKRLFDDFLRAHSEREGTPFTAFDSRSDYRRYVDGKPRFDGVRSFLSARGIVLPDGGPADDSGEDTVFALGMRKDRYFNDWLNANPVRVFASTVNLILKLRAKGMPVGIFTASRNCEAVLSSAGLMDLFDARVDGVEAEHLGLRGKPEPDSLIRLSRKLRARIERVAVVEDAIAGVKAGSAGGFGLVIGLDREAYGDQLAANGASLVLPDLGELDIDDDGRLTRKTIDTLPTVQQRQDHIARAIVGRQVAVFLDYDGTLTPIVVDRTRATLSDAMRATLSGLAKHVPVAVISGRDLADIRRLVALPELIVSGSHGVEVAGLAWGKGDVLRELMTRIGYAADGEVAIYIGDDVTDEDAFRMLGERSIGIVVGSDERPTSASYSVPDPAGVQEFLDWLAQTIKGAA